MLDKPDARRLNSKASTARIGTGQRLLLRYAPRTSDLRPAHAWWSDHRSRLGAEVLISPTPRWPESIATSWFHSRPARPQDSGAQSVAEKQTAGPRQFERATLGFYGLLCTSI